MTTFTVPADVTYAGAPTGVDLIDFTNAIHTVATATFVASDFDNVKILDNVLIDGTAGANHILVSGGSLNASGWTFGTWSVPDSITINGSAGADLIFGSSKDDVIAGGLGGDTLTGGDGNDTFSYSAAAETAGGGYIDAGNGAADALRIAAAATYNFSSFSALGNLERLVFDTASGSGDSTAIFGSVNFGGGGISNALAVSGDENDNWITINIVLNPSFSAAGWTFSNWSGSDFVRVFGTVNPETITGSSQPNTISGGGGADTLTGGDSDDVFSYQESSDPVAGEVVDGQGGTDQIEAQTSCVFSLVTLTDIEALKLTGVGTSVTLTGGQIGSGGITAVHAGGGTQALIVNGAAVNLKAVSFTNWTTGADTVTINGTAGNNSLTGSNRRDTLNGNAGNDTLDGGAGLDTLNGGLGNDTYALGAETDIVSDTGGTDTITSTNSRSLAGFAGIDNLTLLGAAANATGNGLANLLKGNASANTLDGKAGGDTMRGLGGNDTYVVDNIGDVVDESAAGSGGTDTVLSSVNLDLGGGAAKFVSLAPSAEILGTIENITLTGSAIEATGNDLANVITANGAANRLTGGLGVDTFTGGGGADAFIFLSIEDTGKKTSTCDIILDFTASDFIDLSAIDAKKGGGDNKFKFIKKQGFHDKKGELHYQKKGGDLVVSGDVNGDGKADFAILLDAVNKIAKSDFEL